MSSPVADGLPHAAWKIEVADQAGDYNASQEGFSHFNRRIVVHDAREGDLRLMGADILFLQRYGGPQRQTRSET